MKINKIFIILELFSWQIKINKVLLFESEIYTTIKDVYLEEDNPHYLEEFKTYIGYNVYSGEETEKQWSTRFKSKYGRDVTL